jgi:hypothetical protein
LTPAAATAEEISALIEEIVIVVDDVASELLKASISAVDEANSLYDAVIGFASRAARDVEHNESQLEEEEEELPFEDAAGDEEDELLLILLLFLLIDFPDAVAVIVGEVDKAEFSPSAGRGDDCCFVAARGLE